MKSNAIFRFTRATGWAGGGTRRIDIGPDTGARRVLVLDAHLRQGLAACRGLGRSGLEVGAAAHTSAPISFFSRYVTRCHELPDPSAEGQVFGQALTEVIERHGYQAVVASDDPTLARLNWLALPIPTLPASGPAFSQLTDKFELMGIAERAGVDYPPTFRADSMDMLEFALDTIGFPVVLKADRSAVASADRVLYSKGATVAWTRDQARLVAASLAASEFRAIVQARVWTPDKMNVVVIRRGGVSEFRYAHRVLREIPRSGGVGITLMTVSPDGGDAAAPLAALERICDEAGYEGLVQAEFYVDRAAGRAWLIDVNPRLWGSTWFVEKMRMRVVEQAVSVALGEPRRPQSPYPVGRRFHHATTELLWFREQLSLPKAILEVIRDARRGDVFEYLDASDMRPLLVHATRHLLGNHGDQ